MQIRDNLGNSDHSAITFAVSYRKEKHVGLVRTPHLKKAILNKLHSLVYDTKWDQIFLIQNTEDKKYGFSTG